MFTKILDSLRYPSTWKGIVAAIGVIGVQLQPGQQEAIITAAAGLVAAIWTFFSDADIKAKK